MGGLGEGGGEVGVVHRGVKEFAEELQKVFWLVYRLVMMVGKGLFGDIMLFLIL